MFRHMHRKLLLALALTLLLPAMAVLAGPPELPANFYGRARVSGSSAPVGSTIYAYVGELELAHTTVTQDATYGSVYTLNIAADNTETGLIDGGQGGDVLTFYIQLPSTQRLKATRTAVWSSGLVANLDLNFTDKSYIYLPMVTVRYPR
jgi:hypothetical protein